MKTLIVIKILILLSSTISHAAAENSSATNENRNWSLIAKYNHAFHAQNSYHSRDGRKSSNSASANSGFFGLGISYDYKFSDKWSVFPELNFYQYLRNDPRVMEEASLALGSLNIGFSIGSGKLFGGLSTQRWLQESPLRHIPAIGYRIGYEWHYSNHSSMYFGIDNWAFGSENPEGNVYNQKSDLMSFSLGYGFRI